MKSSITKLRKNIILIITLLMTLILLSACDNKKSKEVVEENTEETKNEQKTEEKNDEDTDIFSQLFDINNKIEINIDITAEQLQLLQDDYDKYSAMGSKSPIYRDTAMSITITTDEESKTYDFKNVGIRMKGNTSRTDFYNSSEGQYNLIHFKVKFEEEFAGLECLDIRWNKLDDGTYIREYYSYEFMRECGLLAPHSNLASVDVAGVHEGVFTIVEPVDKLFIERNLPEEDWDGDLYKCGWDGEGAKLTSNMTVGIEDEETGEFYNYDLKNNKKTSNHELMNNLLETLNAANVSNQSLEEVIDMEYFLKFAATSYFVGNPDDIRYDYNNYYIYFLKSNDKAIFIPCDNDRCFGVTKEWNPTGDGMTSVNPFSTMADGAICEQENPLFIHTVDAGGYFIDEYVKELEKVAKSKWLTSEHFSEIYEIAYNNYKDDTTPDKKFRNAEWHKFKLDNSSSGALDGVMENVSFANYIEAKMGYYNKYIGEYEKYYEYVNMMGGDSNVNENDWNNNMPPNDIGKGYSVRGTFNDWELRDEYIMSYDAETNTYSYTITINSQEWLKIASNDGFEWYGYEKIIENENISYDEEHYDIILDAGTYEIVFDGDSCEIKIK